MRPVILDLYRNKHVFRQRVKEGRWRDRGEREMQNILYRGTYTD